jgi:hypothetical protein
LINKKLPDRQGYTYKGLGLAAVLDGDKKPVDLVLNLKREVFDVGLNLCIVELAPKKALDAEHGVCGIPLGLVLSGVTNEMLGAGE